MASLNLRTNFHQLIDSINNEVVLSKFYELISKHHNATNGDLWNRLSKEELDELLLSDLESEDADNLIPHSKMAAKHKKWL